MRTLLAASGFTVQRDGPVMIVNSRKYALFTTIKGIATLLLLHGPANRDGLLGIGFYIPVPIINWWRSQCLAGSFLSIAAQCKDTQSRYTLIYGTLAGKALRVKKRNNLPHAFLSLVHFKHEKAPYVKPPRKARK